MKHAHPSAHLYLASLALAAIWVIAPAARGADFDAGHLFVTNLNDDRILELNANGELVRVLGEDAGLVDPRGIAFGPDGLLYVTSGDTVVALSASGSVDHVVGGGTPLSAPRGIAFGPRGRLYATSTDRVLAFDEAGAVVLTIGAADSLFVPVGLAFGVEGNLYVASAGNNSIFVFDTSGAKIGEVGAGSTLNVPTGVAIAPCGRLLVASLFSSSYLGFDADGNEVLTGSDASLALPAGLALGPDGNTYVSSTVSGAILAFDKDGAFVGSIDAGGEIDATEGLAFAPTRQKVKISGTIAQTGGKPQKVSEKATLVWSPGTREFRLLLKTGELAETIGSGALTLAGFVEDGNGSGKKRTLHGVSQLDDGHAASLEMSMKGKLVARVLGDVFTPKSGSGRLVVSDDAFVFSGSIKSIK